MELVATSAVHLKLVRAVYVYVAREQQRVEISVWICPKIHLIVVAATRPVFRTNFATKDIVLTEMENVCARVHVFH